MANAGVGEYIPLTARPVPPVISEQLGEFTLESLQTKEEGPLGGVSDEGGPVIAIDIGGDSLTAATMALRRGKVVIIDYLSRLKGVENGQGYVQKLEEVSEHARVNDLGVGLSFAGPLDGTKPLAAANLSLLKAELNKDYGGDFAHLFPTLVASDNDAIAGLRAGALYTQRQDPRITNVIYIINGSGENASVLVNDTAWSMESGHLPVVEALNPLRQTRPCVAFGAHVCIERVAGGKAGVEDLWQRETGEALSGKQIEDRALRGDKLAAKLYDDSAIVTAHMVLGVAEVFGLNLGDRSTAVVGHGGTFKYPEYGQRVQQALGAYTQAPPPVLYLTHQFTANACLDGAALAALTPKQPEEAAV